MGAVTVDSGLAALFGAATVCWVALRLAHPRRSPLGRMSGYLEVPRVHLGGAAAETSAR